MFGKKNAKTNKQGTISGRVAIGVAIPMIIILLGVAISSSVVDAGISKDLVSAQNKTSTATMQTYIDATENDLNRAAAVLSRDPATIKALSTGSYTDMAAAAASALGTRSDSAIALFDKTGAVVYSSGTLPTNIDAQLALGDKATSDYYTDSAIPLTIRSYKSVLNDNGEKLGGLAVIYDMADYDLVDEIKALCGYEVTIFVGNTRLATTILNAKGERVVGTTMLESIEDEVINKGNHYNGENYIVYTNMLFDYEPLKDNSGAVVGALFTGYPTETMDNTYTSNTVVLSLVCVGLLIVMILILTNLLKKGVATPIRSVVKLAEDIRDGNLHGEHISVSVNNELSLLMNTMNDTEKSLNAYINDISEHLNAMAARDFTKPMELDYIGDFAPMKTALEAIRKNMASFIVQMQETSTSVKDNANIIATSAQSVAQSATEQAASVEELSASIINVSENVDSNTSHAREVKDLSNKVADKISQQNAQMDDMLSAMNDIEQKSSEIQKIIKTIDDIAFQTNILALNAAVEAARAGEAGKGFAVVADEVRNLASKSAEAAKNTTSLIQASINSVQQGSLIATAAAESLKSVVDLSAQTKEHIEEITDRSEEQAGAIKQITIGLEQINTSIQQNSATAEESSASSEELFAESQGLYDVVQTYKV